MYESMYVCRCLVVYVYIYTKTYIHVCIPRHIQTCCMEIVTDPHIYIYALNVYLCI